MRHFNHQQTMIPAAWIISIKLLALSLAASLPSPALAQRQMENLTRGLVAVSTGDLDAIADGYAFPALVVDGTTSEVVPDPDAVRDAAVRTARGYRERGLVAAQATPDSTVQER